MATRKAPLLLALLPSAALATVPDAFGTSAREVGLAGGGVALVEDGTAALRNPAGLSRIRRPTAMLGAFGAFPDFRELPPLWWDTNRDGTLDDADAPLALEADVDDVTGFHLAAGRQVGGKFGIGLAGYVPTSRLIRIATYDPQLPHYFMYANRPQRYVFAAGVGGEILPGVNLGASVDFVPSARATVVLTATAVVDGDASTGEDLVRTIDLDLHAIDIDVVPGLCPILGLQLDLGRWDEHLQGLVIGAMYRHRVMLPITVRVIGQVDVVAADVGELDPVAFAAIADAGLVLDDHFQPATFAVSAAWRSQGTFSAYADARWTDWRPMRPGVARVVLEDTDVQAPLVDLTGRITDGNPYDLDLGVVWSARAGVELRLPELELSTKARYLRASVRGGFGFEPSPLRGQGPDSAFLDADRTIYALGAGFEFWDPLALLDGPMRLDAGVQLHALASGALPGGDGSPVPGASRDGSPLPIGGRFLVGSVAWTFDY